MERAEQLLRTGEHETRLTGEQRLWIEVLAFALEDRDAVWVMRSREFQLLAESLGIDVETARRRALRVMALVKYPSGVNTLTHRGAVLRAAKQAASCL